MWRLVVSIFSSRISNVNAFSLTFRALKDQGYQSDSTLVFKKRSDVEQLSPVEQKTAYKSVQLGGEVPLHGFRKPLPERPRGECDLWPRNLSLEKTTNIVQIASTMKHQHSDIPHELENCLTLNQTLEVESRRIFLFECFLINFYRRTLFFIDWTPHAERTPLSLSATCRCSRNANILVVCANKTLKGDLMCVCAGAEGRPL